MERWEREKTWNMCAIQRGGTGDVMVVTGKRVGGLSLLASLPGGVSWMVCNSMELKHMYTQAQNMPWLWVTMEA